MNGAFLAQSDTILFQVANETFSCPSGLYERPFSPGDENLSGRNEAASKACSADAAKRIASENDAFSFCLVSQSSRKTAQRCLEKLRVRTISLLDSLNWFHWLHSSKRAKNLFVRKAKFYSTDNNDCQRKIFTEKP